MGFEDQCGSKASIPVDAERPPNAAPASKCGYCDMPGRKHESCEAHVTWHQSHQKTCEEALVQVAKPPPHGCGCKCEPFEVCTFTKSKEWINDGHIISGADKEAVYINNCKFGLHGPLEILSSKAVTVFVQK